MLNMGRLNSHAVKKRCGKGLNHIEKNNAHLELNRIFEDPFGFSDPFTASTEFIIDDENTLRSLMEILWNS